MNPLLALLLALLPAPHAAAIGVDPDVYSLEDCERLAARNSTELQSAEQGIIIAKQQVNEAALLFSPDMGVQALGTRYRSRYPFALRQNFHNALLFPSDKNNLFSGQAYMSVSLYEGMRHVNTLRMARAALRQAQSRFDAVKMDILYEIHRVFYGLILAQESAAAAEAAAAAAALHVQSAGRTERLEAESLAAELRAAAAEARHDLELARLDFLKGLNREFDAPVRVSGRLETSATDADLRKALLWAAELRPELRSQTYKSQMDAIAVNLALGRRYPTVTLGVDYELTGQDFPLKQNNWDATVGIRLPFSLDYFTQHKQKIAEQRQGEIVSAELQDRIQLEVRRAWQDLQYWQAEWPRREEEYKRLKALAEENRGAGALERLRAEAVLLKARRAWQKAVAEHILARARLDRAVGRPTSG